MWLRIISPGSEEYFSAQFDGVMLSALASSLDETDH